MTTTEDDAFVTEFRRRLLSAMHAPDDVDMSTVTVTATHEDAVGYPGDGYEPARTEVYAEWDYPTPQMYHQRPNADGVYRWYGLLYVEDVVSLINSMGRS